MASKKELAAAKKRSEASKKAAATRKANESKSAQGSEQGPDPDTVYEPYSPSHKPLQNAGLDQHAAEKARQEQLAEERAVHNERTGDGGW